MTADLRQWCKPPPRRLLCHCWRIIDKKWLYHFIGAKRGVEKPPTLVFPQPQSVVVVRLSLPALSSSLMCFSASLISSPPLCFSYTPSQSHKGTRGRRANKPVVVQGGRSGAGQRRGDGGRTGNEVESEAVVPLGPNQDSPVCVCLLTWMNLCLCGCMHVFSVFYDCVSCVFAWAPVYLCGWMYACVSGWRCSQFVCVCACRLSSGWLCSSSYTTANCWLHSTCFVLALLCSAPIISPGACAELDGELCLTRCYSSLPLQLFSPWLCAAEDTSAGVLSRLRTQQTVRYLSPTILAHSLDLSPGLKACLLSLMTLWQSRGDQFRSTSCLEAPWCVFWDSLACRSTPFRWFIRVSRAVTPLASGEC